MTTPNSTNSANAASAEAQTKAVAKETAAAPPSPGQTGPFATRTTQGSAQLPKQNKIVLLAGGATVVVLLLFILISFPSHKAKAPERSVGRQVAANQSGENSESEKSLFPVTESGRSPNRDSQNGLVGEQDVQRTAIRQTAIATPLGTRVPPGGTLSSIPPFDGDTSTWQTPLNQAANSNDESAEEAPKREHDQPSLVFVRKVSSGVSSTTAGRDDPDSIPGLGLATGTRLRARLEAAASTAVRTPVIAVVEYNYQKNGEIIVPAGAKALGHIEQADRSGYLSIRFDSLLLPDGSSISLDAVATDLRLRPLKGKVEGKNSGKNVLIRSLSGIGQVGAVFAGRSGGLNGPLSEGDLVRERLGTNIGESADQEIARLSLTERIVVSVDANTPIYVVLDRGTKQTLTHADHGPASTTQSLDSLRQILQLQRELNQNPETSSH
jgi:hypothetical protein